VDYQVSLSSSKRHILIKVLVPMTSAIGVRCGTEAIRLGAEKKVNGYLFDLRDSPNVQTVVENYEFAHREIADFGFPRNARSAFLVRPGDRSHDFINTAFFNAGYVTQLFTDEAAAVSWLEGESLARRDSARWRDLIPPDATGKDQQEVDRKR
jgi:hypothetical protein